MVNKSSAENNDSQVKSLQITHYIPVYYLNQGAGWSVYRFDSPQFQSQSVLIPSAPLQLCKFSRPGASLSQFISQGLSVPSTWPAFGMN